jgi:hypothetical protein
MRKSFRGSEMSGNDEFYSTAGLLPVEWDAGAGIASLCLHWRRQYIASGRLRFELSVRILFLR